MTIHVQLNINKAWFSPLAECLINILIFSYFVSRLDPDRPKAVFSDHSQGEQLLCSAWLSDLSTLTQTWLFSFSQNDLSWFFVVVIFLALLFSVKQPQLPSFPESPWEIPRDGAGFSFTRRCGEHQWSEMEWQLFWLRTPGLSFSCSALAVEVCLPVWLLN